jgi:hypothetical protein
MTRRNPYGRPATPPSLAGTVFQCSSCSYGIRVSGPLPACPMCQQCEWRLSESRYAVLPPDR